MLSKTLIQSLMLFLIMMIPGCYGSETTPDVYGEGRPNLFIGGICQVPNTLENSDNIKFSDKYDAIYIPTYYKGCFNDLSAVDDATPNWLTKSYASTYQNGLERPELSNRRYDIIFAYSGGTRSVLTAIEYQGLRANTLVLISPIRGLINQTDYQGEITYILERGYVKNIVVLRSSKDQLWGNEYYQSRIGENWDNRIRICNLDEELTSTNAHEEIFSYSYYHLSEILSAAVAGASILAQDIVTLTLFVHEGDLNGPSIPNALISVKDGFGRDFLQTTDDSGSVTITGDSGGWTISASASGYEEKSWYKSITSSSTEYLFLEEIQPPPQSSVVGKWSLHHKSQSFKTPMMSKMKPIDTLGG